MKLKSILFLLLTSVLLLSGCSLFGEDDKQNTQTEEHKKKDKKEQDKKEPEKKEKQADESSNDENSGETSQDNTQSSNETATSQKKNLDVNNVTDRASLEAIIYGDYSEYDKILAYNSAVANGIIPQGNVMEGPAAAAYESSLRIERGEEQSIYEKHQQDASTSEDVNAEINSATTNEERIDALRKKYNGGLSSGELQTKYAIEQGYYDGEDAEEVYSEIQRREADIAAGKYDHYQQ
ncbi:hypothetical protein GJU84_11110 [Staphylococcus chromogenes]|uniref:hypothetical protein n=1 Tax=Staphylococcus chromogenes TaxID=46126 RepID=UPI00140439A5|nr:hypothetical protein [Staphylococcus chromogenes]QIN27561.1 hypothetical protein GJU84_11110 [Staphylococcus chromogenes]